MRAFGEHVTRPSRGQRDVLVALDGRLVKFTLRPRFARSEGPAMESV